MTSTSTVPTPARTRKWRVVDIVTASVIGVAAGVVFWAWGLLWGIASVPLAVLPGLSGLLAGGWLFAGVLGGIIIRKPGAALYTEVLAAVVSMLIGTQWGWATLVSGAVQGLGAELVFAAFFYANWRGIIAVLGGIGSAIGLLVVEFFSYYAAMDLLFKTIYSASAIISGALLAGLGSWAIARGLAATGALSRFAAGRDVTKRV